MVIDAVQRVALSFNDSTVSFFFCKYGNKSRNSFSSVARSLLAQLLAQRPHLLPIFYEQASLSSEAVLRSTDTAKEMLQVALGNCTRSYVIIDGLDECDRTEGREIAAWLQNLVEDLPSEQMDSIKCLLVSQDDAISRIPTIRVTSSENKEDLKDFVTSWHKQIETKFGPLRAKDENITNILLARSQGLPLALRAILCL